MAIEPFIDLKEDYEGGEDFDFDLDPCSRDCFVDYAQPVSQPLRALRMGIVNGMHGIGEEAMASPEMLVVRRQHLGGLRARMVGSSSRVQAHNNDGLPLGPNVTRATINHISA